MLPVIGPEILTDLESSSETSEDNRVNPCIQSMEENDAVAYALNCPFEALSGDNTTKAASLSPQRQDTGSMFPAIVLQA